jgi:hypothetical protein
MKKVPVFIWKLKTWEKSHLRRARKEWPWTEFLRIKICGELKCPLCPMSL